MGWMSGWNSRKELVKHLTDTETWEREGISYRRVAHKKCFRGNDMWVMYEVFQTEDGVETSRGGPFIALCMLQRWGNENWAYKDVEETCGPNQINCPVSWLDEVPDPGSFATEWRAKVRAGVEQRKKFVDGAKIKFDFDVRFGDGKVEREFTVYKSGRRTLFKRASDNQVVSFTPRLKASVQFA